jgi:cytochrome c-type biogenesis protein
MTEFNQTLVALAQAHPWLAPVAVFLGGVLTASNPCVLAMVPLMIGFVGGDPETRGWKQGLALSAVFVLGLALVFAAMGMLAALGGRLLGEVGGYWPYLVGAVAVLMGLHLAEIVRVPIPAWSGFTPRRKGFAGALVLGAMFGIVSAPCAVPILALVLTGIAAGGLKVLSGAFLLVIYALGHSILILLAGSSMGLAKRLIEQGRFRAVSEKLRRAGGLLVAGVGLYLIAAQLW